MKITFTMTPHENKPKHSTRFEFEKLEPAQGIDPTVERALSKTSFYIPKPIGETAKRIRVTIEEL